MTKSVGVAYAPGAKHTKSNHPEHAGRTAAIWQHLNAINLVDKFDLIDFKPATLSQLLRVHERDLIRMAEWSAKNGRNIGPDTYTTIDSYNEAILAAGAACAAVDGLLSEQFSHTAAIVRPPGHHAGVRSIEGFCLFNNIAIAARQAQVVHGVSKIAIVDFDVHHGNGTQDIFYQDDSVLFFSMQLVTPHFYPGTGYSRETGKGFGTGMTVNIPFPPGVGENGYLQIMDDVIRPINANFNPDLILVSAGFDAHWRDPLSYGGLNLTGFAKICQRLVDWADELCDGRISFVLEGGYDLEVLQYGVENMIGAMLGSEKVSDPIGDSGASETDITILLEQLKHQHLLP